MLLPQKLKVFHPIFIPFLRQNLMIYLIFFESEHGLNRSEKVDPGIWKPLRFQRLQALCLEMKRPGTFLFRAHLMVKAVRVELTSESISTSFSPSASGSLNFG